MKNFECLPEVILRTPMYSYLNLLNGDFDNAFFEKLKNDKLFEESLLISSPILHKEFFENEKNINWKEKKRIELSVMKYFIRTCTRPTPFGTFSGLSVLKFANSNNVKRKKVIQRKAIIYLDYNYSIELEKYLLSFADIRKKVFYKKNSSIEFFNKKISYIERVGIQFNKNEIESNNFLKKTIQITEHYTSYNEIVKSTLELDKSLQIDEVEEFVDSMIVNQLLRSHIEPSLEESNYLDRLVNELVILQKSASNDILLRIIKDLNEVNSLFKKYCTYIEQEERIEILKRINIILNSIDVKSERSNYYQVDTLYDVENGQIDKSIKNDIFKVIRLYYKINNVKNNISLIDDFKKRFIERYANREVALQKALDPDIGIGFRKFDKHDGNNPLIDDIPIFQQDSDNKYEVIWSEFDTYIFNKYIETISNNDFVLKITDDELKDFKEITPKTSDSFVVILNALDQTSDFRFYFRFIGLNSPNRLLGRFSMLDDRINSLSKTIDENSIRYNKNFIVAEINHLPADPSMGNVLRKQAGFKYEITYLTKENKKIQINVNDLFISVRNNTIFLRSKSLNRFIIPKLSSAHAYGINSASFYHFLSSLDDQNKTTALHFKWGIFKNNYRFHPRVAYKDYILRPAYWFLDKNDIEILKRQNRTEILNWRKKNRIPQYVSLVQGDNHLYIDMESQTLIELLISEVKNKTSFKLEEFFKYENNSFIVDEDNAPLTNELIFSFINKTDYNESNYPKIEQKHNKIYFPGDKWLFIKFFLGRHFSDEVLLKLIKKIVNELKQRGDITSYFFIRFQEHDEEHIRLRLEIKNNIDNIIKFINLESRGYVSRDIIWKISIDTYFPEYEKYGGLEFMSYSERIFYFESKLILRTISIEDTDEYRVLFALKIISLYLNLFKLSIEIKQKMFTQLEDIFNIDFGIDKNSKKIISKKYIDLLPQIKELLINNDHNFIKPKIAVADFELEIKSVIDKILNLHNIKQIDLLIYAQNHIHMFINRLFSSKPNLYELLIYHFLCRYYKSEKYLTKLK